MLKVTGLKKVFGGQTLFEDISFTINKGERIGLVGRNGYGKTTLFKLILNELESDAGKILIPKYYKIGFMAQEIKFNSPSVIEEACLGLSELEKDFVWKARKILFGLGFIEEDMLKSPAVFSGGYQIRLNLAKVLLSQPDLLLLDEPNNYLDIISIRWLIDYLKSWKNELMLITHDRHFMDNVTTHTLCIHRKRVKKIKGTTGKLYSQIAKEEEVYENTRVNEEKKRKQTELFIDRFRAKARLGGMVQSRIKALDKQKKKDKLEEIGDLEFKFNYHNFPSKQMMSLHNVIFSYDKKEPYLINKFSFDINKRERIAVIGKNGKGKSTLLKILAGECKTLSGKIKEHPELRIGYFSQTNVKTLNDNNTIVQEIMSADSGITMQRARDISGVLMFNGDDALKRISVLSGGEKNRVALGKILATSCNLLLLDEPTNHLDLESCETLLEAIIQFEGSVIVVTHNEGYLERFAEKLIIFDKGDVRQYQKGYDEFLNEIGWDDEKELKIKKSKSRTESTKENKQEQKRLRAELVKEKSRMLSPLKRKIDKLEEKIISLEKDKKGVEQNLLEVSQSGEGDKISMFSKKLHDLTKDIDMSFEDLELKTEEYTKLEKSYKLKMAELNN